MFRVPTSAVCPSSPATPQADRPSSSTNTGPHGRRRRSGAGRTPAVSTKKKEDRKAWSIPEVVQVRIATGQL